MLPLGDQKISGKVKRRKRNQDGNIIGTPSNNPILDTTLYEVEFDDGHVESYAANLIAENIYEQLDDDGNVYKSIDQIIDHRKDASTLQNEDSTFQLGGRTHKRKTTCGWQLCILWKDRSTSWENLKDLKESNPIDLGDYAEANKIDMEPAFSWWVPFTLQRRRCIMKIAMTRYQHQWQKYGIEIPKTVKRALEIDQESGADYWRKALQLEMSKIFPAVRFLAPEESDPIGHQEIPCHIVFDVKMDFTRKARYVAGGRKTGTPEAPTYASVVKVCVLPC